MNIVKIPINLFRKDNLLSNYLNKTNLSENNMVAEDTVRILFDGNLKPLLNEAIEDNPILFIIEPDPKKKDTKDSETIREYSKKIVNLNSEIGIYLRYFSRRQKADYGTEEIIEINSLLLVHKKNIPEFEDKIQLIENRRSICVANYPRFGEIWDQEVASNNYWCEYGYIYSLFKECDVILSKNLGTDIVDPIFQRINTSIMKTREPKNRFELQELIDNFNMLHNYAMQNESVTEDFWLICANHIDLLLKTAKAKKCFDLTLNLIYKHFAFVKHLEEKISGGNEYEVILRNILKGDSV